jgi:hypothetical protein
MGAPTGQPGYGSGQMAPSSNFSLSQGNDIVGGGGGKGGGQPVTGYGDTAMQTPMGTPIIRGNVYAGAPSANYSPLRAALGKYGAADIGAGGDSGYGDSGFGGGDSGGVGVGDSGGVGVGAGGEATGDSGDGGTGAASSATGDGGGGGGSGGK